MTVEGVIPSSGASGLWAPEGAQRVAGAGRAASVAFRRAPRITAT